MKRYRQEDNGYKIAYFITRVKQQILLFGDPKKITQHTQ